MTFKKILKTADSLKKHVASFNHRNIKNRYFPFFQSKLTVGPTDDFYEWEADSVADRDMRMHDINDETIQPKITPVNIQRMCSECEEEEKAQRKEKIAVGESLDGPSIKHDAIGSGGNPMDDGTKKFMENGWAMIFPM